jgi:hypothetical protein
MRTLIGLSLAAGVGALAVGLADIPQAHAADMQAPQAQMQPPPGYYGPPPVEESEAYPPPPPPVAYGYPPPPVAYYAYAPRPVIVDPYAYYWRGYGPRVAYGYGRWGRGYRHW